MQSARTRTTRDTTNMNTWPLREPPAASPLAIRSIISMDSLLRFIDAQGAHGAGSLRSCFHWKNACGHMGLHRRVLTRALQQLAPDSLKSIAQIGRKARPIAERRIEDAFHIEFLLSLCLFATQRREKRGRPHRDPTKRGWMGGGRKDPGNASRAACKSNSHG